MEQFNQLFNVISINEELESEFYKFFTLWGLQPLLTDAHRTESIKVTDSDARAVVNSGGAYNKDLKKLSELMNYASDNKSYQQAIFSLIHGAKSFRKFMMNVRKINQFIENEIKTEHQYNRWNIVFYNEQFR